MSHTEFVRLEKWDMSELPSLSGKVAIITGANSPGSLGFHVAHQLALKGAKVYVGARTEEKAMHGIGEMIKLSPTLKPSSLHPLAMDLGNFQSVQKVAQRFVANEERLDILVNNAGIMGTPRDRDEHGISVCFGTNHLGTFLFTMELMPLLKKTEMQYSGVRIVNVASSSHYYVPDGVRFRSIEDFNTSFGSPDDPQNIFIQYGKLVLSNSEYIIQTNNPTHPGFSKLANILFTKELQRRLDSQGSPILCLSLDPGNVATDGAAKFLGRDSEQFKLNLSPFEGAITPLWAAAHPELAQNRTKYAGAFVYPWGGLKEPSVQAQSVELATELWETSEKVLGRILK